MIVSYVNYRKDKLEIQLLPGLPIAPAASLPSHLVSKGIKGLAESVPIVRINGKQETPYQDWPMIESPFINMDNSILKIDDGKIKIAVAWQGNIPVITKN